jgi:hypothetical protein
LVEPFYAQTLQQQMIQPFHQLFRRETSMQQLIDWAETHPGLPLRGLIFHLSRCGSTLIAQMLAASERNVVASEPSPFNDVLCAPEVSRETRVRWLRAMAAALGQPRIGSEQNFYLKLDPWHMHHFDLIHEAFPDAPWIFVYREPLEVMVSHQRQPGAWLVPSLLPPSALGLELDDWDPTRLDVYYARALASLCEAALRSIERYGGLLVNYSELPEAMDGRLFHHFHLLTQDLPAMQQQASRNAKTPQLHFKNDTEAKQSEAGSHLRETTGKYLSPLYLQLERLRQASPPASVR